jgi:hypothetical protein
MMLLLEKNALLATHLTKGLSKNEQGEVEKGDAAGSLAGLVLGAAPPRLLS